MLVIVTGASKGFGRSLAVEMAKAVSPVTMVRASAPPRHSRRVLHV
jgi:NAD(P)-dependent dehydrogenase (short-subunit alcohol dehydrogenase family)